MYDTIAGGSVIWPDHIIPQGVLYYSELISGLYMNSSYLHYWDLYDNNLHSTFQQSLPLIFTRTWIYWEISHTHT